MHLKAYMLRYAHKNVQINKCRDILIALINMQIVMQTILKTHIAILEWTSQGDLSFKDQSSINTLTLKRRLFLLFCDHNKSWLIGWLSDWLKRETLWRGKLLQNRLNTIFTSIFGKMGDIQVARFKCSRKIQTLPIVFRDWSCIDQSLNIMSRDLI